MASAILSNKLFRRLCIALPLLAALALSYARTFDIYELQTYDWRCRLRGARPVSPDIALIEIADDTLHSIGQWPIDRKYYAALIEILRLSGAKALIFDVLFVEPGPSDSQVTQAARAAGNVYFSLAFKDPRPEGGRNRAGEIIAPTLPEFAAVAKGLGFVNVKADIDGKRRRVPLVIEHDGKRYFHVSFKLLLDLWGVSDKDVTERSGALELPRYGRLPLDDQGCFLVNYAGVWKDTFEHYSFVQILTSYQQVFLNETPDFDLKKLKGKICVLGYTATASHDANASPLEPIYPNVGIHANVMNSLLQKDFIRRCGRLPNLGSVALLAAIVLFLSLKLRPIRAFSATLGVLLTFLLAVMAAFVWTGVWLDLFYPVLLSLAIYTVATLVRMVSEIRKRQVLENELKIASQIQKSFLPESPPECPGIRIAVYMKPAKAVGGDLYAFLRLGEGSVGVMVGDVSGKGTPAALFMAKAVSEFKFSARDRSDPAVVLSALNASISSESTGGLFVTLSYAIFDVTNSRFCLSNGGHLPVVCVRPDGSTELVQAPEGMPIGVLADAVFANFERGLFPGELYALYSDGVSEARNRRADEFGVQALQDSLSRHRHEPPDQILEKTVDALRHFMGKAEQHDDITLIIVKIG